MKNWRQGQPAVQCLRAAVVLALAVVWPFSVHLQAQELDKVKPLYFTKPYGGADPVPQIVTVTSGNSLTEFTASARTSSGGDWLSVSSSQEAPVNVSVNAPSTLDVGSYSGELVLERDGVSRTVEVNLIVTPPGMATFDKAPSQIGFFLEPRGAVSPQVMQIGTVGSGDLQWRLVASTFTEANFLTVSAESGTGPKRITVGVNTEKLPDAGARAGVYTGQLLFVSARSTMTVPVRVVVGKPDPRPAKNFAANKAAGTSAASEPLTSVPNLWPANTSNCYCGGFNNQDTGYGQLTTAPAIDGSSSGQLINEANPGNGSVPHYENLYQDLGVGQQTMSFYFKPDLDSWVYIRSETDGAVRMVWFHLSGNGTVGTNTFPASTAQISAPDANGWYRCSVTFTVGQYAINNGFGLATGDTVVSYTATPGNGVYEWGQQFNNGTLAPYQANASPCLSFNKTADATTVSAGSGIGYTMSLFNHATPAVTTTLSDQLPAGSGVNWTIVPGNSACSITGAVGSQLLTCNFPALAAATSNSVHVMSGTAASVCAQYNNTATLTATGYPGYSATANASTTVTCSNPSSTPSVVSGTPTSATNTPQTFTFTGRDGDGFADINLMYFLVKSSTNPGMCYGFYNRATNGLYLYNDAFSVVNGPLTPGSAGTLQNSQCVVNGSSSSLVSAAGTDVTLNLGLSLQAAYATVPHTVSLDITDKEGHDSGWVQTGTWNISGNTPVAVSGTPSSATNTPQTFTFTGRDGDGFADINLMYFLVKSSTNPAMCYGFYNRGTNSLYLYNDAFSVVNGPLAPGSGGTLQNSQCVVNGSTSSVASAGTDVTLNVGLSLQAAYASVPHTVSLDVIDGEGHDSGWVQTGTWNISSGSTPTVVSGTPTSATNTPQTFTFTARDGDGFADINLMYFLVKSSTNPAMCYGFYNRATNSLYLYNDAFSVVNGPLTPGSAGTLQNSQCVVNGSSSSLVSAAGTDVVLNLGLSLQAAYATVPHTVSLDVVDNEGHDSGWVQTGTWNISGNTPTVVSGTPTSATNTPQTFTFTGRDPDGYADINLMYFLVKSSTNPGMCYGFYNRATNGLYLYNDAFSVVNGPLTPGSAGTLQNSQCVVNGSTSSLVSAGGTDVTLNVGLSLQAAYATVPHTVLLDVIDKESHDSGWVQTGTWIISGNVPTVVSGTPTSPTTTPQMFTFTGRDGDGFADINLMYFLVKSSTNPAMCYGFYNRATNSLYLYNDAFTVVNGPLTPGSAGTLQNSQCVVNGSTSSLVSAGGTDVVLNLGLSLQAAYATVPHTVLLDVIDNEGHDSGWIQTGTWNVQ